MTSDDLPFGSPTGSSDCLGLPLIASDCLGLPLIASDSAVRITDRLVGAVGPEEARLDTQAKWQDHSEKHGSTKLHIFKRRSMQNRSMRDITLLLRKSLSRKLRVTTVEADIPGDEGGNRRQSEAITVAADMPGD